MEESEDWNDMKVDVDRIKRELEPMHKASQKGLIFFIAAIIYFVLGFVIVGFILRSVAIVAFHFILSIVLLVWFGCVYARDSVAYHQGYKRLLVMGVLKSYFENPVYKPEMGIPVGEFQNMHLIKWKNNYRYNTEDLVEGSYKGIRFRAADVVIYYEDGDEDRIYDVDGSVLQMDCPKKIDGYFLVKKNVLVSVMLEKDLKEVKMEDMDFNEKFKVYSNNEHSVFYLLTPQYMESVKKLHDKAKQVFISFDGEHINVLRSGGIDNFEPGEVKNMDIEREVSKLELQVENMIDVLEAVGVV